MKKTYFIFTVSIWCTAAAAVNTCPEVSPCVCGAVADGISISCKGNRDAEQIKSVVADFRFQQKWELLLESLDLDVLPSSVRNATSLRLNHVRLNKLLDEPSILWPELYDFVIESSTILNGLLQYIAKAPKMKHLKVSNFHLPVIGSEFEECVPPNVSYLDIRKTGTMLMKSGAMSRLKLLKYLLMVDIPLKEFPRDALPEQLLNLHTFILGNTQIEKLDLGFFEGMPNLEVLMLHGNKMKTLDFRLFQPVENHLTHLLAENNPLLCGCDLKWLFDNARRKKINVLATCFDSETNKNTEISSSSVLRYC